MLLGVAAVTTAATSASATRTLVRRVSLLLQRVMKATCYAELLIDSEKQWQSSGFPRVDIFFQADVAPCHAKVSIFILSLAKGTSWHMVKILAECILAKGIVLMGMQNEFMPHVIDYTRRHAYESAFVV
jgi:hypothetical protein